MAIVLVAGCRPASQPSGGSPKSSLAARADRGAPLLNAAAAQLNDLPSYVDTQMRQPTVILDSRKSSDGNDVLATCTANPDMPNSPINLLSVPAENGRFKGLRVRPGDIVKYYIRKDEESEEIGIERWLPVDLTVAQVPNDNTILLAESLAGPVDVPIKIEIWRYLDDRLVEISEQLKLYAERRLPVLGWEPSPDKQTLKQIVDQLNQWMRQIDVQTKWQVTPLLKMLDERLRKDAKLATFISEKALAASQLDAYDDPQMKDGVYDGRLLQEAVWLRDISRWALGEQLDDVNRAVALFDWTVRNVQLENNDRSAIRRPWQILLFGQGTADQRAWVFALLCRQQGLDAVVLTPSAPDDSAAAANEEGAMSAAPALIGVLIDGNVYLFDARLGLPIPGPAGNAVATLEQLRADDALLRALDLGDEKYPLTSKQLERATAQIVADPFDLSRSAVVIEQKLKADHRVALAANADEVAARFKSAPGVAEVRLWDLPFRTLMGQLNLRPPALLQEAMAFEPFAWHPKLWKARVLHFQGRRRAGGEAQSVAADDVVDDHALATELYTSKDVRLSDRDLARVTGDKRRIAAAMQTNAGYWVGLLLFDDGKLSIAAHWLGGPELLRSDSPWPNGAHYNLARTLERLGRLDEAVKLYQADTSPQRHGNRLRAKWLSLRQNKPQE
jgi:hypothetical protein